MTRSPGWMPRWRSGRTKTRRSRGCWAPGGNLGRQDLSSTYLQMCRSVLEDRQSRAWLSTALNGRDPVPLPRKTLGQYNPGGVANPEEDGAVGNPWRFVLLIEGALLFATAVVRRHGADYGRAAVAFQVRGSTAGFDSAAANERALAELWAPEWSAPVSTAELAHLLGEGRAEWNARPAQSGLDFARAVATLGVDRGIDAFQRHVFVDRLGQSPLAVPGGRVLVAERGGVALLAPLDRWLDTVRRSDPPAGVAARVRAVEQALFTHAGSDAPTDLVEVFATLGGCHEAVSKSGAVRAVTAPLVLPHGKALLARMWRAAHHDVELRIALALATAHDASAPPTLGGLRPLLSPVHAADRSPRWTGGAAAALGSGLFAALAEAARRRGFPGATTDNAVPAVRGARLGFAEGLRLCGGDLRRLVGAAIDEQRTADLLAGLLTVDWRGISDRPLPGAGRAHGDPGIDPLVPFTGTDALPVRRDDGAQRPTVLRPGHQWPALLAAGRVTAVLGDAAHRLRIAGTRHVVTAHHGGQDGRRLAALLLVRTTLADRLAALRRVAVIPPLRSTIADQESPA
ncbi:type I-G CRISPR-associated protein Cas8g1/Csx17 [Actinokineospora sp.]|uniref:type I-G CRISPR-associated protein Cas8g1/Csx17 n=1 Tax=Actinokineospora sp. TaxID=1872133 RepID=UPI0040384D95